MESVTDSGLIVEGDPPTVGPRPGDVTVLPAVRSTVPVQPWAGWPAEWQTPNWYGRVEALTDVAWSCLDLNSSLLSAMPPYLVNARESLDADWLNNPNPLVYSSWEEFAKQLFWDFQGAGEAFVLADSYYVTGWPARFHVVPPWLINAELDGNGLRTYRIGSVDVTASILHIRYSSTVGDARGHGPLEVGSARLVAANALLRYATDLVASGGVPPSVITHPARLTAEQAAELQYQWVDARSSALGYPAVLSGGVDFKTMSYDPEKMALVDLSKWNESRIAVLLGVPPFLMGLPSGGDSLTYSNVESLFDYHWRAGLKPKASTVMSALSYWALPRGTTVEVNRDEYVRPGPLERAQTWALLIEHGVITAAQAAEFERYAVAAPSETLTSGVLQ